MAPFYLRGRFHNKGRSKSHVKKALKEKRSALVHIEERHDRMSKEMEKINEQHRDIREGHSKMREEFEAFKSKCDKLRKETEIVLQRTARTQIKLALMARILKAKEQADLDTAAHLTQLLREIVERENEEEEASEDS